MTTTIDRDTMLSKIELMKKLLSRSRNKRDEVRIVMENTFDFIQTDLEVRCESLKCHLEKLEYQLHCRLDRRALKSLNDNQNNNNAPKILFLRVKGAKPNRAELGKLHFELNEQEFSKLRIKTVLDVSNELGYPMNMCILRGKYKDELAVITDFSIQSPLIIDNKLERVKKLTLDCQIRGITSIDSNRDDLIFIVEKETCKLLIYDTQSSKLVNQFENIKHVHYFSNKLYGLESDSNQVVVFSCNGEFKKRFSLSGYNIQKATSLKISENYLVLGDNYSSIVVFDLTKKEFMFEIRQEFDCFIVQDWYIVVCNAQGEIRHYDLRRRGSLSSEIKQCGIQHSLSMLYFNKRILISFPWSKKIVVLE